MAFTTSQIKAIQQAVGVTADGIFGPKTQAAVVAYQRSHGLTPDGIVGPKTMTSMRIGSGGGGGAAAGGNSPAAQQFADNYGYQLAFLKSSPELYGVFQKAMSGNWDSTKFVAAVKDTNWYKTHGDAYRTNTSLKYSDPASYNQKLNSSLATTHDIAASMGASLSSAQLAKINEDSVLFGWNDAQIRDTMSHYINHVNGTSVGTAGDVRQSLQQTAFRNGINLSSGYIDTQAQAVARGDITIANAQQAIRSTYAKSIAPGFAKELDGGQDLYDLASPYMQTMAQTLELNPSSVTLFDPSIKKALATSTGKDGTATSVPLWQFQENLKQDPRYMQTTQAQNDVMATGKKVLTDMGLI